MQSHSYQKLLARPSVICMILVSLVLFSLNAQGFIGAVLNVRYVSRLLLVGVLALVYLFNFSETNRFIMQTLRQRRVWFAFILAYMFIIFIAYLRVGREVLLYSSSSRMTTLFFAVVALLVVPSSLSIALYAVRRRIDLMQVIAVSVVALLLANVIFYGMGIQGRLYQEIGLSYGVESGERFNPPLVESVYTASFLGFILVLYGIGAARYRFSIVNLVAGLICLGVGTLVIYATASRMYLMLVPLAILISFCSTRIGFIGALLTFVFFIHVFPYVSHLIEFLLRFEYFGDSYSNIVTASGRTNIWEITWHEFIEGGGVLRILFGDGYLSYLIYPIVEGLGLDPGRANFLINKLHPHSASLELLINTGILGFALALLVFISVFWRVPFWSSKELKFVAFALVVIISTLGFVGNIVQYSSSFFILMLLLVYLKILAIEKTSGTSIRNHPPY